MAKKGRPTKLTLEIQQEILDRLSHGESARSICRDEHMPDWTNLCRFKRTEGNELFRYHYAQAKCEGIEARLDAVYERVLDESRDYRTDSKGEVKSDNTAVMRDRLIADQTKWEASKLFPKQYGDKITQEHTGADGGAIKYEQIVDRPPKETAEQWQARVQKQLSEKAKHIIQ